MMRLAMTRCEEGGSEVPVATSERGASAVAVAVVVVVVVESGLRVVRLKKSVGTEPHVSGAMNVATAERPGCRNRSYLWTSLDVLPPCENRGLMTNRRGPHCMIISSLDLMGSGSRS